MHTFQPHRAAGCAGTGQTASLHNGSNQSSALWSRTPGSPRSSPCRTCGTAQRGAPPRPHPPARTGQHVVAALSPGARRGARARPLLHGSQPSERCSGNGVEPRTDGGDFGPALGCGSPVTPPHTHNGPVPARALEPSLGEEGAGTRPRAPPAPHRALCDPERHEAGSARRLAAPTGGRRPPTKGPFTHPERFRARGGAGGGGGRPRGDEWDLGAGRAGSLGKSRAGPQHVAVAPTADSARAGGALRAPICPPTHHPSIIHPSASAAVTPTAWSRPLPSAPPQRPVLNVTLPPERRVRR